MNKNWIHLENNPWKRNINNTNENIIKLMESIKVNNGTKHLINNIIVGIKEKIINRKPNNMVIKSLLCGLILDTSISK